MKMKHWLTLASWAGLQLASAAAQAQQLSVSAASPWSVGAQVGAADMGVRCNAGTLPCQRSATSYGLYGAYALDSAFGLRLGWQQTGRFKGSDTTAGGVKYGGNLDFELFDYAATWRTELAARWSLELRAGAAIVHGHFAGKAGGAPDADRNTLAPVVGLALEYPLQSGYALRLDSQYTRGQVANTGDKLLSVTVGLVAHF
jgi:hypothetical protein